MEGEASMQCIATGVSIDRYMHTHTLYTYIHTYTPDFCYVKKRKHIRKFLSYHTHLSHTDVTLCYPTTTVHNWSIRQAHLPHKAGSDGDSLRGGAFGVGRRAGVVVFACLKWRVLDGGVG